MLQVFVTQEKTKHALANDPTVESFESGHGVSEVCVCVLRGGREGGKVNEVEEVGFL